MIGRVLLFVIVMSWAAPMTPTVAEQPTSDQIIKSLQPKPRLRSARGAVAEDPMEQPPSINMLISFEYNSAKLLTEGVLSLDRLGAALRDVRLAKFTFQIVGHTDAKGSVEFNQGLSERRAASVRGYLIEKHGIEASRLQAMGRGKSDLADPTRPEDGINRRVQIVNVGGN